MVYIGVGICQQFIPFRATVERQKNPIYLIFNRFLELAQKQLCGEQPE